MKFHFIEYNTSQRKQYINARQLYEYYIQKRQEYLKNYQLSMYWREVGGKAYLTKKHSASNRVISLGAKSEKTIEIYESFIRHKKRLKEELKEFEAKLDKTRKLNKIEQLTRVPAALVKIYRKINELGLDGKMILVGTNALYAYEAACGVFLEEEQLATDDIDLLNKKNHALSVIFTEVLPRQKLTELLKLIDKSFEPEKRVPYRFRNKEGIILEILTPVQERNVLQKSEKTDDFTDIPELSMEGMQWLENSRIFQSMVIADNGRCAILSTIHPLEFAVYKHWLSTVKNRDILKKRRDYEQSKLVTQLIREYMVNIDIDRELHEMKHFKNEVIKAYKKEILEP